MWRAWRFAITATNGTSRAVSSWGSPRPWPAARCSSGSNMGSSPGPSMISPGSPRCSQRPGSASRPRPPRSEIVAAIDRNLALLFWVIAAAGMAWLFPVARREPVGQHRSQAPRAVGPAPARVSRRGDPCSTRASTRSSPRSSGGSARCSCTCVPAPRTGYQPHVGGRSRPGSPSVFSCPDTWPAPPSSAVASKLSSTGTTTSVRLMPRAFPSLQSQCCRRFLPSWLRLGGSAAWIAQRQARWRVHRHRASTQSAVPAGRTPHADRSKESAGGRLSAANSPPKTPSASLHLWFSFPRWHRRSTSARRPHPAFRDACAPNPWTSGKTRLLQGGARALARNPLHAR